MSQMKRFSLKEIEKMKSQSDQKKFDAITDDDILEQIVSDPDTPYLTEKDLREMKLANEKKNKDIKKTRASLEEIQQMKGHTQWARLLLEEKRQLLQKQNKPQITTSSTK